MSERNAMGVQVKWRVVHRKGLEISHRPSGEVEGISQNGKTAVPEVDANLVSASGEGAGFEKGRAIGIAAQDPAFCAGGQSAEVGGVSAEFAGFGSDGCVAHEMIVRRVTLDAGEVD